MRPHTSLVERTDQVEQGPDSGKVSSVCSYDTHKYTPYSVRLHCLTVVDGRERKLGRMSFLVITFLFQPIMVDLLILGAGWTSTFLIPLCKTKNISVSATSRSGNNSTVPFEFLPDSDDPEPYRKLPDARTIVITFPINTSGASERLVRLYQSTRSPEFGSTKLRFIQLGTTGIWEVGVSSILVSLSYLYIYLELLSRSQKASNGLTASRHQMIPTVPKLRTSC